MNGATRIWAMACGAGTVAVLAGGWFLGVQPALASAASTSSATTAVNAQNQATAIKVAALSKVAAKTSELEAQNAVLLKAVPTILKPNTFIRRIEEVAALDGVEVRSVQLGDAVAYTAPTAADATTLALGTKDPSITSANFASVPATVQVTGSADAALQFAHDIQIDERVFALDTVQTTGADSGGVTATLGGNIYVLKR